MTDTSWQASRDNSVTSKMIRDTTDAGTRDGISPQYEPAPECPVWSHESTRSGRLNLILRSSSTHEHGRVAVFMKIKEVCPKHYAVLYSDASCKLDYGCFNSSDTVIKQSENNAKMFEVSSCEDGSGLLFETDTVAEADKWITAFRCNTLCPFSKRNRRARALRT